ncbi:MAG: hypothetical protein QNK04_06475 [Myxococcota bacterium]|nr:hypothetical protein [Myxococcota bacterium]
MNDLDLLLFGCAISFIALAGFYVYARERFVYAERPREAAERTRRQHARVVSSSSNEAA